LAPKGAKRLEGRTTAALLHSAILRDARALLCASSSG